MTSLKTYVINLDDQKDRWRFMEEQLRPFSIDFKRLPATSASEISKETFNRYGSYFGGQSRSAQTRPDTGKPSLLFAYTTRGHADVVQGAASVAGYADYKLFKLKTRNTNCAAYIIDRWVALALSRAVRLISRPTDFAIASPEFTDVFGVDLYQMVPSPFIQDMYLGSPSKKGFQSGIESSGSKDAEKWREKPMKRAAKAVQALTRLKGQDHRVRAAFL